MQDHDRAWILGETTFGKGLVQSVFPLSENTALALTTAHYYTPSGRLIQRDYSNISFLDYYYNTNRDQKNMADVKMTDSGRTVYGGGGITPDEKYVPPKFNKFQIEVLRQYGFFKFSAELFRPASTDAKLPKGWEPDENVVNEFHEFLLKNKHRVHGSRVHRKSPVDEGAAQARNVHHRRSAWKSQNASRIEQDPRSRTGRRRHAQGARRWSSAPKN